MTALFIATCVCAEGALLFDGRVCAVRIDKDRTVQAIRIRGDFMQYLQLQDYDLAQEPEVLASRNLLDAMRELRLSQPARSVRK